MWLQGLGFQDERFGVSGLRLSGFRCLGLQGVK